ncbi:hypothetical protein GE061_009556 [Apolygus lucorum]|uniref:Uncharacterized protein n=1 Tax=Apolygus lucorum TaxID=248454 RepID=A0A8S9Y0V8_APOLU|nr:hypothetical protein GE061_009556 [Apolygus lucorum]
MLNQETERQVISHFLRHLADLDQKITVDHIIGLLPVWFLQRFQRPPQSANGQQPWKKPRTLEEMAEEFALSQRCGALIYEIFTSRPRMAYTNSFIDHPCLRNDKFCDDDQRRLNTNIYALEAHSDLKTLARKRPLKSRRVG